MKTIVLALDGSEGSARATPVAASLAQQSGARIVVAHVDERIVAKGDMPSLRADEDQVFKRIESEVEKLAADGIDASIERKVIVLGGPAREIADVADEVDADVIVVGTRGQSQIAGLLLGSVTTRLLHIAKRPVLAVPPSS